MPNSALRLRALVSCFGLLFGFGIASVAGVLDQLSSVFSLDAAGQEWLVSSLIIACFLGALLAAPITTRWGRRPVMLLCALMALVGYAGILGHPNYAYLLIMRSIIGISIGISSMVVPMYAAEITPPAQRGAVVALFQLAITAGILFAYTCCLTLLNHASWHQILAIGMIPAAIALILTLSLPESPAWLAVRAESVDQPHSEPLAHKPQHHAAMPIEKATKTSLFAVFMLCAGLFVLQNLSGIDGIIYYAPHIFQTLGFEAGTASLTATFGLGSANFISTLIAIRYVDRAGRRPLLLWGSAAMCLGMAMVIMGSLIPSAWLGLAGLCIFIMAFATSLGPLPYVMMSELFPVQIRETGIAIASSISWLFNALIAFTFLSAVNTFGLTSLMVFFLIVCLLSLIVGWRFLPETRDVSLAAIERDVMMGRRLRELGQNTRLNQACPTIDEELTKN